MHEFTEILQQAVAEIRTARTSIALQVNSATKSVYWNLSKLLFDKQFEEGYSSCVIKQLSVTKLQRSVAVLEKK